MNASQLRRLNAGMAAVVRKARLAGDKRHEDVIINRELARSGLGAISITKALAVFLRCTFGARRAARQLDRQAS